MLFALVFYSCNFQYNLNRRKLKVINKHGSNGATTTCYCCSSATTCTITTCRIAVRTWLLLSYQGWSYRFIFLCKRLLFLVASSGGYIWQMYCSDVQHCQLGVSISRMYLVGGGWLQCLFGNHIKYGCGWSLRWDAAQPNRVHYERTWAAHNGQAGVPVCVWSLWRCSGDDSAVCVHRVPAAWVLRLRLLHVVAR